MKVLAVRTRAWRSSAAVLTATVALSFQIGAGQTLSAEGVLDQYVTGNAERVVAELTRSSESVSAFSRDLKSTAPGWITVRGPNEVRKRELAVATLALEAARWLKPAPFGSFPMGRDDPTWQSRADLLEWACALLRSHEPALPAERSWQLASLALIEGAPRLFNAASNLEAFGKRQVAHARARFPDEPRIRLAEAIIDLESTGTLGYPLNDNKARFIEVVEQSGAPSVPGTFGERDVRKHVQLAVAELAALLRDRHVGAEAELRIGATEVELSEPEPALGHLSETLELTTDPFLCYHARFFRAAAYTTLTRTQEAEADYRAALNLAPRAQSATVGLAWLFAVTNRPNDASALVSETLASGAVPSDPYASFRSGDLRLWATYVEDLRAAIR